MRLKSVNSLNAGLMVASCGLAFLVPVELFLLSYIVLGPLHYLTEISWLHDRRYFAPQRRDALLLVGMTVLVLVSVGIVPVPGHRVLTAWGTEMGLVAFAGAGILVATSRARTRGVAFAVLAALALALHPFSHGSLYGLFFSLYLITIIHVFVFTGAFLLLGAMRSRSRSGGISFLVFLACAAACFSLPVRSGYVPFEMARDVYGSFFTDLNRWLLIHAGRPGAALLGESGGHQLMRFIAFAYTYHYLNWFSKTSVIRWHEVPRLRFLLVLLLWGGALALYAWDVGAGVRALFGLSLLHVYLEFPLNFRSFRDLGRELGAARRQAESSSGPLAAPVESSAKSPRLGR